MVKLIEGLASRLKVPPGRRDIQVFDDALPGFGIRKFESGKAFYFVKFAVGTQQRKLSLGPVVPGVLILSGQRKTEIGDLSWPEVDLEKRQIDLPPERTKNGRAHLVPLSDDALRLLKEAPR